MGAAQRAGGVSPPLGYEACWISIGGLNAPRSLFLLLVRLHNAENTHKFFTHPIRQDCFMGMVLSGGSLTGSPLRRQTPATVNVVSVMRMKQLMSNIAARLTKEIVVK